MELFADQELNFEQVKELTRGMFAVARVDGVHDRELAMIRSFYEGCSRTGDPRFEDVLKEEFEADRARRLFDRPELAKMMVKTLMLLAFADGEYAQKEDQ